MARGIDGGLRELRHLGPRMMLDQPQNVPAPGRDGCPRSIKPDSTAKIEAERLGARCQIVGVSGERCLECLGLDLGEAIALPGDARIGRGYTLLNLSRFN